MKDLATRAIHFPAKWLRWQRQRRTDAKVREQLRQRILAHGHALGTNLDEEQRAVHRFLADHPLVPIPYPFADEIHARPVKVLRDPENGLPYVEHSGKRLYFKRNWTDRNVEDCYKALLVEQDERSPHRYVGDGFQLQQGDIVADVGSAEGIFALGAVEQASEVHLFEGDPTWSEALNATFKPWKEKVRIVQAFVGDRDSDGQITLDKHFGDRHPTVIKVDVEGAERRILEGSRTIIGNGKPLRMAVCTYHRQNDEHELRAWMEEHAGCTLSHTPGFMLFSPDPDQRPPYLRRGMLRAWR